MKDKRDKILNISLPIISVLMVLIVWAIAALSVNSEYILPSISQTAKALLEVLKSGEFYSSLAFTLLRSVLAFLISFLHASLLVFLSKRFSVAKGLITPIISILRALPTVAVVLILLFWTNSFVAPIIVTMLVILPTIFTGVSALYDSVDKGQLLMCKAFNVDKKQRLTKVILPQIAPSLLTLIGSNLSLNLKLMVAAEVLSATPNSIGLMLNTSKVFFEISSLLALVCVCIVFGLIIEGVFSLISKKVGKWQ